MYGRTFVPVHYTEDLKMPIDRILEQLTPDAQLLILCQPNNPLGNVYTEEEFQTILELRYLCFKPWEQIAVEMGYELRYVFKLHGRALDQCEYLLFELLFYHILN